MKHNIKFLPIIVGMVFLGGILLLALGAGTVPISADNKSAAPSAVTPWAVNGNSAGSGYFLGTTNNKALVFKVNGQRALKIEPKSSSPNLIGGYKDNAVTSGAFGAVIGGGGMGGQVNRVTDSFGTIGGGQYNQVGDNAGTTDDKPYATIGGGGGNIAGGYASTVGGGMDDLATANYSTVNGGRSNHATGEYAAIGGGRDNVAAGDYSVAGGRNANIAAAHDGAFLFADSQNYAFNSAAANEFAVRSAGGARIVLAVNGSGTPTWTCSVANGGSWSCSSDRQLKENLIVLDGRTVLSQLSRVPIYSWNAKGADPSIRHAGPTAQDFYAAFGLGNDDKTISTIDLDGVSLTAIQGMYEIVNAQDKQIAALEARVTALEKGTPHEAAASNSWLAFSIPLVPLLTAIALGAVVMAGRYWRKEKQK